MSQPAVVMAERTGEKSFYTKDGVSVTNARFVVRGQTFSVANITSVRYQAPKRLAAFIVMGCSLLFMVNPDARGFGVFVFLVGAIWAALANAFLVLTTAGAEVKALKSRNAKMIQDIVHALNEAIIHRG